AGPANQAVESEQVRPCHQPHQLALPDNRHAPDAMQTHQVSHLFGAGLIADADDSPAHDVPNRFAAFADDVVLADHADQKAVLIDHRKPANTATSQLSGDLLNPGVGGRGDDFGGHNFANGDAVVVLDGFSHWQ